MDSKSDLIRNAQEAGDIARRYAQVLGQMPQAFAIAVRNLMIDLREGSGQSSQRSAFQIRRLLKAPTILSSLYFATKTFFPKSLSKERPITPLSMSQLYDPLSLASLLALAYLYRRSTRICDKEEWKFVAEPFHKHFEMGALIGAKEKEIGMGVGMLTGTMLFVAFSTLLSHDKKGFVEYRRHLKKHSRDIDTKFERSHWGCTSAQIAANVLLSMGFGVNLAAGFAAALLIDPKSPIPKEGFVRKFFLARTWINSLNKDLSVPQNLLSPKVDYSELMDKLGEIVEGGSLNKCLERRKDEIGDGKSPELVIADGENLDGAKVQPIKSNELAYTDLPYDIKAALSETEFHPYRFNTIEEIRAILGMGQPPTNNPSA